jgi:transcriptional regulator with GAF, ATPase, and Fis domain
VAHDVLKPAAMMTTETFMPADALSGRIDRLTGHMASAAVGLGPEMIDAIVADALRQVCEVLNAETATLDGLSDETPHSAPRRTWLRHGVTAPAEPALTIPVAVSDGSSFTLSIGKDERSPWPASLTDALRDLAHVMVLTVLRAQQIQELERVRFSLSSSGASGLGRGFSDSSEDEFENIIGDSPALRFAIVRVQEVAPTDASVMLLGETGTGKELFARAVHNRSTRRGRPFVSVNCAALPSTLIETELFGHVRGAFTGAVGMRQGRFEVADGGTLFLDEIGDLPPDVQAKLLRVLQEGQFERVGASQSRKVDVRIVAATHHNLEAAMKEGRFRADLYYRLNVFPIALPPLRERLEDLPRLVWYFVNRRQRALNRKFTCIPDSVFTALAERSWPGNVRELANVIERAMIHSTGSTLVLDEAPPTQRSAPARDSGTLEEMERQYVEDALRRCRWRINGRGNAAEVLGLHPNTLRNRMKKFGIQRPKGPVNFDSGRLSA